MTRRLSNEVRAECIRLRVHEQLSTPTIARQLKLSTQSVYKILAGHVWLPNWPTLKGGPRATWLKQEVDTLKAMYATADKAEILGALPNRGWPNIAKKASALGLRRPVPGSRKNTRYVQALFRQLRAARETQKLTRVQLSARCGYHVNVLLGWELGKRNPDFRFVVDWAAALGFDIVLKPRLSQVSEYRTQIPRVTKERLMAGRA